MHGQNHFKFKYLVVFMTVVHTYFYIVVDTQRGCHTLKKIREIRLFLQQVWLCIEEVAIKLRMDVINLLQSNNALKDKRNNEVINTLLCLPEKSRLQFRSFVWVTLHCLLCCRLASV